MLFCLHEVTFAVSVVMSALLFVYFSVNYMLFFNELFLVLLLVFNFKNTTPFQSIDIDISMSLTDVALVTAANNQTIGRVNSRLMRFCDSPHGGASCSALCAV